MHVLRVTAAVSKIVILKVVLVIIAYYFLEIDALKKYLGNTQCRGTVQKAFFTVRIGLIKNL